MKDVYNLEQAQKQKKREQKSLQEDVDAEILEDAARLEKQNYSTAKAARKRLERSAELQKETTDELRRQGASIRKSKKAALNVHKNVGHAGNLADDISKESRMFNIGIPFWGRIKKWWGKDTEEDKRAEAVKSSLEDGDDDVPERRAQSHDNDIEFDDEDVEECVPGQKKTDEELKSILKVIKNVREGAAINAKLTEKQTTDLKDITKLNEYSKKKVDKTDTELNKGLK